MLTLLAAGLLASGCESVGGLGAPSGRSGLGLMTPEQFDRPLWIPTEDTGVVDSHGVRRFALTAMPGVSDFGVARTDTWGFNGDYLGPTLRAKTGERVGVRVTNELTEETTVHWHGMHLPARMDGGPHQPVAPGDEWTPEWSIRQTPATLWYHPHPHGETEQHVYRGLAGLFIVDPADGPDRRLPHRYGVDDIPVILQDKRVGDDGRLDFDDQGNEIGLMGDRVLANGVWGAFHEVATDLVRLRILNGSTARSYRLGFGDDRPFDLIGSDGGLLEAPSRTTRVQVSPGERVEIVVTVTPGEVIRLRSYGADLGGVAASFAFGGEDEADILELRASDRLDELPPVPAALASIARLDPDDAVAERQFVFEGREINGRRMDMGRIDEVVVVDTTEIWEVHSRNLFPHNFHVHDVQFQVLSIDGAPPPPELAGLKDTIYLAPRTTYRLIMRFADHADPDTPYMYHCHLLLHEDEGMMGQFVVVERGEEVDHNGNSGHHH